MEKSRRNRFKVPRPAGYENIGLPNIKYMLVSREGEQEGSVFAYIHDKHLDEIVRVTYNGKEIQRREIKTPEDYDFLCKLETYSKGTPFNNWVGNCDWNKRAFDLGRVRVDEFIRENFEHQEKQEECASRESNPGPNVGNVVY